MKHTIILLFLSLFIKTSAQDIKLPRLIPESPQAQGFAKQIDYPACLATGIPEISIPLYTIKTNRLSVPISLSYHASGFKPNEKSSSVGQGWSLNAGNRISRAIKGVADEKCLTNLIKTAYSDFPFRCDAVVGGCVDKVTDPETSYLIRSAGTYGYKDGPDTDFDIFYYDYPGNSGKFIFERNSNNGFLPLTLPYKPINIKTYATTIEGITHFEIIDENGNTYRYGKSVIKDNNMTELSKVFDLYWNLERGSGKTSWLLTEIISTDKSDTIYYEYTILPKEFEEYKINFSKSITRGSSNDANSWKAVDLTNMTAVSRSTYTESLISKIKFKTGEVRFNYLTDNNKFRLNTIEVIEKGFTNPSKTIKLELSKYKDDLPYWYKLDAVNIMSNDLANIQKYSFKYYRLDDISRIFPNMIKPNKDYEYYETYSIDYWGFYNGANNTMLLAKALPTDSYKDRLYLKDLFGTADRNPNPNYAQIGVLNQITYPTGGIETYEYEGNMSSDKEVVGGLRVKKISLTNGSNTSVRTYSYQSTQRDDAIATTYLSDPNQFRSVTYGEEKSSPQSGNATDYTKTYTFSSSSQINYNLNSSPILYYKVTEYIGDELVNNGRIEHTFDLTTQMSSNDTGRNIFPPAQYAQNYPWYSINTLSLSEYTIQNYYQKNYKYGQIFEYETITYDNQGAILSKTERKYSNLLKKTVSGFLAKRIFQSTINLGLTKNHYFWQANYTIEQLSQHLDSETTYDYGTKPLQNVPFVTKTSYTYNKNNLPILQNTLVNNRDSISTQYRYPNDFSTLLPYNEMVSKNIISPIIEKTHYKNDILLNKEINNYQKWNSTLYAPVTIQTQHKNDPVETRIKYYNYDQYANPVYATKDDATKVVYLWSYNGQYPIAEIQNATYTEVETVVKSLFSVSGIETLSNLAIPNEAKLKDGSLQQALPKARVSTYTYHPLVGILTATDPSGITTYYDYDTFGRLKETYIIENGVKKVLQANDYHYQNQ